MYVFEFFLWKEMIKNYVYKCVFGMGVMYLVFYIILFFNDEFDFFMYCFVYIIYIFIGWVVEEVYVILCGFYELCCIKFRVICVVFFYYVIDFV